MAPLSRIDDGFIYKAGLEARALDVKAKLARLLEDRLIEEKILRGKILDVGVGYGGSYIALSTNSKNVDGIEPDQALADMLIRHCIVPEDRLFVGKPLDFLGRRGNQFDLITVLHLFSGRYCLPIEFFHREAVKALSKGGQLLYTSETDTSSGPNYVTRLAKLPRIDKTQTLFIPEYPIGPDNVLLLVTKP